MKSYALYSKLIGACVSGSISLLKPNFKLSNSAFYMRIEDRTDWFLKTSWSGSGASLFHFVKQAFKLGSIEFYKARMTNPLRSGASSLTKLQEPLPASAVCRTRFASQPEPRPNVKTRMCPLCSRAASTTSFGLPTWPSVKMKIRFLGLPSQTQF